MTLCNRVQVIVYSQHFCITLVDAIAVLFNLCINLLKAKLAY